MTGATLLLAFVTLQRLAELVLAARNTRRLRERGAVEVGAGHYPLIVGLHAAWLAGLWGLGRDAPIVWPWLFAFALLQGLRVWVIATLGERVEDTFLIDGSALQQNRKQIEIESELLDAIAP